MNYLDPKYQEFLRRQMLGQAELFDRAVGEPVVKSPVPTELLGQAELFDRAVGEPIAKAPVPAELFDRAVGEPIVKSPVPAWPLGQTEPVMLDASLVPAEPMAQAATEPAAEAPVEPPKPMTELEQIQARIGQASAQTQDAAKQYQDWLAGLGGRFRSDMESQTAALKRDSELAYRRQGLNEALGSALSILGLKDAAQPYQQMAVQAAQIQGQAPQKQQQLFSDYLQKVAGLEGRGLESKMEMAGRLEQGARGELTKYQDRLSQEMRHAQSMLMAAKTAEEQRKWQEEMKRLEIASREANAAAERQVRISEGALNRENQRMIAEMGRGAKASEDMEKDIENLSKRLERYGFAKEAIGVINKYIKPGVDIPGFGRGGSLVPDMLASPEALEARANVLNLADNLLRIRTGANAPLSEVTRLKQIYTMLKSADQEVVREGMRRLKEDTLSYMRQDEAGYRPEVVREFQKRGGFTSKAFDKNALLKELRELEGEQ